MWPGWLSTSQQARDLGSPIERERRSKRILSPGAGAQPHRLGLTLAALGVVYGDIGTSPIYAIRECFSGDFAVAVSPANVLGILSLVFWSLTIIVSIKYLGLVLRADNNGEGGAIALTALLLGKRGTAPGRMLLAGAGLFAASLLYGDGMITPAISVLSAIEGVSTVAPGFRPWVIPVAVMILAALFMLQPRGTERPVRGRRGRMSFWRGRLFAFLLRNAMGATTYYGIPPSQVIEIGSQVRI